MVRPTPIALAAGKGHERVVKMLLERDDVNPNGPSDNYRTPLWSAAYEGHKGVVKVLLGRSDVSPDKRSAEHRSGALLRMGMRDW